MDKPAAAAPAAPKLTQEQVDKKTSGLMAEYLGPGGDLEEAVECVKELEGFYSGAFNKMYMEVLEKKQSDRDKLGQLVESCMQKSVVKPEDVGEALCELLPEVDELEMDIPKMLDYAATFCAQYLANGGVLKGLVKGLESLKECNKALKLLLKTMSMLKDAKSEEFARECLSNSGVDLKSMLASFIPAEEADTEVAEGIERAGVAWLQPLLGCQQYLTKEYTKGTVPAEIVGWIKEHVAKELREGPKFARIMMRALLNHSAAVENTQVLQTYAPVMQAFFQTDQDFNTPVGKAMLKQQTQCLFEVQLYCYEREFRDKVLLNLFRTLYNFDVIEEEAFMAWSEDQEDSTPDKGKAIMEAGPFLRWLEEQQDEESDEEDED